MEKDGSKFQLPEDDFEQWRKGFEEAVAAAYGEEDKEKKEKSEKKSKWIDISPTIHAYLLILGS